MKENFQLKTEPHIQARRQYALSLCGAYVSFKCVKKKQIEIKTMERYTLYQH